MPKVRVALLGCGGFMGVHANRLKGHSDVEIVGLCDEKQELAKAFYDRNLAGYAPAPGFYSDPAAMYAAAKPAAVFIATPHTLHFKHGMQALDQGLHVYMEKPMVTSAEEAYRLAEKAKGTGKIVVVGYNTPCSPEFNYLRRVIRDGTLGKLELIISYLSQDWRRLTTGTWRQKPELSGGGQAYDSGAHMLNSLVWAVESPIDQVSAFIDQVGTPVDINSAINIRFENGTLAAVAVSGNCPASGSFASFIFDRGRIDVDAWNGQWIKVFDAHGEVKYPPITDKPQTPDDNFIDAVLGRAEPRTNPGHGIIHSELMDAIYESARTGKAAKPKRAGATR